jgi:hypothetical protein
MYVFSIYSAFGQVCMTSSSKLKTSVCIYFQVSMVFSHEVRTKLHDARTRDLKNFIGDGKVRNFSDFVSSIDEEVAVVLACCFDVVEGVDMWFHDETSKKNPRFL